VPKAITGTRWDCADAHDLLHLGRGLREHHRIGRLVGDPGEGVGVLLAHRKRGDQAVAERRRQRADHGLDRFGIAPGLPGH
jgi:hypothetical protein